MNRRDFVRVALAIGGMGGFRIPLALAADYWGKLAVFVQADGGWDPTSFCDPKTNVSGEPVINHWAESDDPRQAGNIRYAPFGKNHAFFEKYHKRMLVINGVDAQTNSHEAGIVHNWSGRISEGYPTTTSLFAAQHGFGMAMPYLSFGGFSNTAGAVPFTRLEGSHEIRNIARPNLLDGSADSRLIKDEEVGDLPKVPSGRDGTARVGAKSNAKSYEKQGTLRGRYSARSDRGLASVC